MTKNVKIKIKINKIFIFLVITFFKLISIVDDELIL
jgi:hypothetical protein